MGGSVIFYTYGSTLELNGQQLTAGMLTADLLNLSPDEYMRLKKRMTQITDLAEEYERKRDIALWWKLNEKMDALCQKLRRYQVFRLLLDEDEDAFFSAIREITEQFSVFPTEDQAPTAEAQKRQLERVANQFSQRDEYAPLDLFHPSEADLEDGMAFYYEMLRAFGPTKGAWRDYQKRLDRYALYLHDIRAFNETIQNFIRFGLSKLEHNSPEEYAKALYGFYNDDRIAEKLIVNPIRNNGDCYTTHDAYELSYVPRPAKDIPKVKVKVTAFARITKDLSRNAISQKDARKAKDYVRDLLYDALRDASISVEAFEESVSSENVYQCCGITRTANPRGRPPKAKAGEQA